MKKSYKAIKLKKANATICRVTLSFSLFWLILSFFGNYLDYQTSNRFLICKNRIIMSIKTDYQNF